MPTQPDQITYHHCDAAMRRCGLTFSATEAQGIAVGLISSAQPDPITDWQTELYAEFDPADALAQECRTLLDKLYAVTAEQLADPGFELQLLLPEAGTALVAIALRDWVQGFLFGFGLAGETLALSDENQALLNDLYEIGQLDVDTITEDEGAEEALAEIEEYLRMIALSLHAERHSTP